MPCESHEDIKEPTDEDLQKAFDALDEYGEEIDLGEWELVEESPVNYEQEDAIDKMFNFASTGVARPNAKSVQDGVTPEGRPYKVRYKYAPNEIKSNSREFCRLMVNAKKIYRKEDIIAMGSKEVNKGWGPRGNSDTYSIWFYKGGGLCHHFWMRQVYMGKEGANNVDAKSPKAEVGVNKAKREGAKIVSNDTKVAKEPRLCQTKDF